MISRPPAAGVVRRLVMTLVVAALALVTAVIGDAATAAAAESPEYAGRLAFRLSSISPTVVTGDGPGTVTISGRFTNTGKDPISDIAFRFQRGDRLTTTAQVDKEFRAPSDASAVVGAHFVNLPGTLAPGASRSFTVTATVFGDDPDSLAITQPGAYPLMMNVNGTVDAGGDQLRARVGELHVILSVVSVPSGAAVPAVGRSVSILWPLVDRVHRGVADNVFLDDDLATEIAPGGRLAQSVALLTDTDVNPAAVTLVVDPMLLDDLQTMADGYRVLAAPGDGTDAPHGRLRPNGTVADTVAGTSGAAAAEFLQQLRNLAARHAVIVLPYGDADVTALVRAGMTSQAAYAVTRGRDVATDVLVRGDDATAIYDHLVTDLAVPPDGAMTDAAAAAYAAVGYRGAVLASGTTATRTASGAAGKAITAGLVAVPTAGGTTITTAVVGGSYAQQFADLLAGKLPGDVTDTVNLWAAQLMTTPAAGRSAIVVSPPRQFSPDASGTALLMSLIGQLSAGRTLVPTQIDRLLAGRAQIAAKHPATLTYPASARAAELPVAYLRQLAERAGRIDQLRRALRQAPNQPDPVTVIGPMTQALLPAASVSWRGAADPAAGQLETIDATLMWLYGGVSIARDSGSYTLASSTAPLILTVRNTLPYEVSVEARIVGGAQAGVMAEGPGVLTIGAGPRSVPVKLATRVSRSGTFTVYAQLYGPSGDSWAGRVPLTIDSRAYGALTVILMSTAGGVLVLMVIWRLIQRARGRINDPGNALVGEGESGEEQGGEQPDDPAGHPGGEQTDGLAGSGATAPDGNRV